MLFVASDVAAQQTGVLITDGHDSVVFALDDKPTVTYTANSVVFTTVNRTVEYPIENTVTVSFVDKAGADGVAASVARFEVDFGEVRAIGLSPHEAVHVYTCDGRLVLSQSADVDGTCSISVSSLPAETLIFKTVNLAFKFIIRK